MFRLTDFFNPLDEYAAELAEIEADLEAHERAERDAREFAAQARIDAQMDIDFDERESELAQVEAQGLAERTAAEFVWANGLD